MVIADTNHLAHGSVIGSAPLQMALCAYQRVNVHYQSPRLVQSFTKRASLVKPKPWFGTTPPFTDACEVIAENGVSGHLHTHRGHDRVMVNHRASRKMTRMAMYMNRALRSLGVSRESRHQATPHAEFGIWLGLVPGFARDAE